MDAQASPEQVVEAAFSAFRNRDGYALASLSTLASLRGFQDAALREADSQWDVLTAEALRAHRPDMPLNVAEWQVKELEKGREGRREQLLKRFPGTSSIDELESLDATELLHRALQHAPQGALDLGWARVLGHVLEDLETAYVVFWLGNPSEPAPFDYPELARLVQVEGNWKLVLDSEDRWGIPGFRNIHFMESSD